MGGGGDGQKDTKRGYQQTKMVLPSKSATTLEPAARPVPPLYWAFNLKCYL